MRNSENYTPGYYPQTHLGEPLIGLSEQQEQSLDSMIRQLKRTARLNYYCALMGHYTSRTGIFVLWFGALAATVYATVWMGIKAAETNHSVPDTIAEPIQKQVNGAIETLAQTDCGLLPGGYIDQTFALMTELPSNISSIQFQVMMRTFLFACNYLPNISIMDNEGKNVTFISPNGNTCNDWVYEQQGPDSNKGAVADAFKLLTKLFGTPGLALQCKNGLGFAGYVTGALIFSLIAVAMVLLTALCGSEVMKKLRHGLPDAENYLSNRALRQRAEDWKNAKEAKNQQRVQLRTEIGGIFGLRVVQGNEIVQETEDRLHAGYSNPNPV